jgi:protein-S-isoprenylcysteine O-methyltransferase Ste14
MLRVFSRLIADTGLVAVLLFVAAGTASWPRAWVLLATMLVVRSIGAVAVYQVSPDLLHERARLPIHAQQGLADRTLLLGVLATGFLGLPVIAAFDVFRWHGLTAPGHGLAIAGLGLFVAGWSIKSLALRANAFAVTVVRLQKERAHTVVDSGLYAVVRHPFYAADPLIFVGLGLWLQSYVAAVCAVIPIALMVTRLQYEERLLRRELPGYAAYVSRVRFRLIPRIW